MRHVILLLAMMMPAAGCVSPATNFRVASLPEGMKVELLGYRFLLRGVHELDVSVRNVGEGMLYRLNDHEVIVITGREIRFDGETLDLEPGEMKIILPGGAPADPADPPSRNSEKKELLQPTP